MAHVGGLKMRTLGWAAGPRLAAAVGLSAALVFVAGTSAHALEFADPIPDQQYAVGFDVAPSGAPDYLLSTDLENDFLAASVDAGSSAHVIFALSECFLYSGATGCQSSVPEGVGPYTGVTTWTVTDIRVPVPEEGLGFFIGGMGNGDTAVKPGNPPAPDYALGSVSVLTGGGDFGGVSLPALDELLLTFGGGIDYVYFGTTIFEVGDALTFGYTVDEQLAGGTPIFFSNAAQNVVVPEPGTAILVGAGLALIAARRARRTADAGRTRS